MCFTCQPRKRWTAWLSFCGSRWRSRRCVTVPKREKVRNDQGEFPTVSVRIAAVKPDPWTETSFGENDESERRFGDCRYRILSIRRNWPPGIPVNSPAGKKFVKTFGDLNLKLYKTITEGTYVRLQPPGGSLAFQNFKGCVPDTGLPGGAAAGDLCVPRHGPHGRPCSADHTYIVMAD